MSQIPVQAYLRFGDSGHSSRHLRHYVVPRAAELHEFAEDADGIIDPDSEVATCGGKLRNYSDLLAGCENTHDSGIQEIMRARKIAAVFTGVVLALVLLANLTLGGTSASSVQGSAGLPYEVDKFIEAKFGQPVEASPYRVTFRSTSERRIWEGPFTVWPWDKSKYVVVDITLRNTSPSAVNYDVGDWSLCDETPSSRSSFDRGRLAPNEEFNGSVYFDLTRTDGTCAVDFVPANTPWHIHSGPVPI